MQSKNLIKSEDFAGFCRKHPELRFWQALREWSKYNFIYVSNIDHYQSDETLIDTYYLK